MVLGSGMGLRHWVLSDAKHSATDIPPQHRNWFARATAENIICVPAATNACNAGILLLIAAPSLGWALSLSFLVSTILMSVLGEKSKKRLKRLESSGHYRELSRLKMQALANGVMWGVMMGLSFAIAGQDYAGELSLMSALVMFLAGITYISVPRVAMIHIICILLGSSLGLMKMGGADAIASVLMLMLTAIMLGRVSKILYDSFATRELRSRQLQDSNETAEILLRDFDEQGGDWLWEVDLDGLILRPSARFHSAAEREIGALAKQSIISLFATGTERDALGAHIASPAPFRRVVVSLITDGEPRWWSLSGRPSLNRSGEVIGLRGVATDVSQSKRSDAKIAHMAHYDALTDLPNRVLFTDTLTRALERKQPDQLVSLLYLDLDRFKTINDSMGHDVGDFVLQTTAKRLSASVGAGDMVSRLSGDEFAIMLTSQNDRSKAVASALAIIDTLLEPIMYEGQQINSGTSIGIAFADNANNNATDMFKNADLALYDAKSRGGNIALMFLPQMYEAMLTRRSVETDLGAAISKNELELYYQPLVSIETNETMAYEALLRWNHSTRGQIQPSVFIPIAEETGLIVQIGEWVIRNALQELATWPEHLSVSVNLSPVQMRSPNIIPTLINALARSGVSPARVEIEITESVLMNDSEANLALLHKFKALGLRVSLDDFGTGYSSLNYLRSFPFDKIKIDRCFVEDIAERKDCQAIIHAVVSLASSLNMKTTAEGIENAGQLAHLKADGCDQAQGYFFSKPMPADQLGHKLLAETARAKAA